MNKKKLWVIVPLVLAIAYLMGPRPSTPVFSNDLPFVPSDSTALEKYITHNELQHNLRPDNEARIVWADSLKRKTAYAIVYLHGFSASQGKASPFTAILPGSLGVIFTSLVLPNMVSTHLIN